MADKGLAPAIRRNRFRCRAPDHIPNVGHKKAPDDAGAFELLKLSRDQYFAISGPPQLKW